MSAAEFGQWLQFYDVEPFGEEVASVRTGIIAATIANTNRDPAKRPEPFLAADFMPGVGGGETKETEAIFDPDPDKQSAIIETFFRGIAPSAPSAPVGAMHQATQ